ncbi:MAG: methylenetetrahydrofolate reductase [NAD(P)H] [Pseudomonadales bacterium]|jgi:methylenetetrahydrofolate reductase (NADPH)|nr:methylenetetrahydrofolate reductase [NAD(P)H] [Pseudomonadales bacterium]
MAALDRVSFEFFPPKSEEGGQKLTAVRERLEAARPEFYSVTYGAGGSTRDRTLDLVLQIQGEGRAVAPHLSMGSDDAQAVRELVDRYRAAGVRRIVALRGDVPSGMGGRGSVHYAAELVALLREHAGDHFRIEVAAYPEVHPDAESPEADVAHFAAKVAAGADEAITQYFYNADAYFDFLDRAAAAGVTVPIIPGIMPITNVDGLKRFSAGCGAEIPRWILLRLEQYRDDAEALRDFGLDVVTALCERLVAGGAPGLHFYTMNQSKPSLELLRRLGHELA